jgi:predicted metal-dependent HD superfamily phosphohydrolase
MRSSYATVNDVRCRYWATLANRHSQGAWEIIDAAYHEPQRAYHCWDHVDDLLLKHDSFSALAVRPDLIATAIFWHDVIYATRKTNGRLRPDVENVRDSAALYCRYDLSNETDAAAVCDMIMATADHLDAKTSHDLYPGFSKDLDLFLDLDLSPLAAPWPLFVENLEKIRTPGFPNYRSASAGSRRCKLFLARAMGCFGAMKQKRFGAKRRGTMSCVA